MSVSVLSNPAILFEVRAIRRVILWAAGADPRLTKPLGGEGLVSNGTREAVANAVTWANARSLETECIASDQSNGLEKRPGGSLVNPSTLPRRNL